MEFGLGLLVGMVALLIARLVLVRGQASQLPTAPSDVSKPVAMSVVAPAATPAPPIDETLERRAIEQRLQAYEAELLEQANERARQVVLTAIQRTHLPTMSEATLDVVTLPAEDVKGRLIGREGRNIRTFEQVTGVDLVIDDAPNSVTLSCFDPLRRAIARRCLEQLIHEPKVYPAKVEEAFAAAKEEIEAEVRKAGDEAARMLGLKGLAPAVREAVGWMKYRTSYAQNLYLHSIEVAQICGILADEFGLDGEVAVRAGLLHDIGKVLPPEWEGSHAMAGMRFLTSHGESQPVCHAVGAHHREVAPESPEAEIVIIADSLSGARPGARRESLEQFLERMKALEDDIEAMPGVDRVFAVQAGREVRVIVKPDLVNDQQTATLAQHIAEKIAADPRYPGQIKVTVIRESRSEFKAG